MPKLLSALLCFLALMGQARAEPVDLELVIAIDASLSIDGDEFQLQTQGTAAALADPRVLEAIHAIGERGVAIAVMQWGGLTEQAIAVPWTLVRDENSALVLANEVAQMPRLIAGTRTAIGQAMQKAALMLFSNEYEGARLVIDLSGDGIHNHYLMKPEEVRPDLLALGIVINGLAVTKSDPLVATYYENYVIGGNSAFVIGIDDFADFGEAMLEKLVQEISRQPVSQLPGPSYAQRAP